MAKSMPSSIETRLFINGDLCFVESTGSETFDVHSPFDQAKLATVPEATIEDVNRAVATAKAAFPSWSNTPPPERGVYLNKLADLIEQRGEEFALLDCGAMGRPISTYFDIAATVDHFRHYAQAGYEPQGKSSLHTKGFINVTLKQPIGVVAAIIPWNIPTMQLGMKIAPAIAAGCTIVLKTSEKAPLSGPLFASLVKEAGFPPGVINIISGHGRPAGEALALHMDVRMINFTGSSATGKLIQQNAAKSNLKRCCLELGGKSPTIIFEDADIPTAARETAFSIFFISGQACVANSRIYVHESIADEFKKAFMQTRGQFQPGNPLDPKTTHGPQADKIQFERVSEYLKLIKEGKGKVETGGAPIKFEGGNGYFIEPTFFTGEDENARPVKEEIFGPVAHIATFKTEEEAIRKAVDTEYGLYSSVYTQNLSRALRVAKRMEAGAVGINATSPTIGWDMPFGGWKMSGVGREGFGYSMENYLETKTIMIKVDDALASQETEEVGVEGKSGPSAPGVH